MGKPDNHSRAGRFSFRCIGAFALVSSMASTGAAATYYVAPTGSNSASGSLSQPFATLQKAHDVAVAGDTVYVRGGTYSITTPANSRAGIVISRSGTSASRRICIWAYPGEVPVFDFARMNISTSGYTPGFSVTGSWLHFKGLEIRNVPMNTRSNTGFAVSGGHDNIFEQLNMHHNSGSGFFISGGTGGHLVLNCDSHDNYDPTSSQGNGENADGFGVHYQESGSPTILRGCRAWWNSDDGFDCINHNIPVLIENSWFWHNGYRPGTVTSAGNGNGVKLGGYGLPPSGQPNPVPASTVRNCLAFLNKAAGFYHNHHPGNNFYYNNTAYNNGTNFNMLGYRNGDVGMGTYRNNLAFTRTATSNANGADAASNSWNISGLALAASDFQSLDTAGIYGPRKPDGSLPEIRFLRLSENSRAIDRGVDVGLPFAGAAPDLGAYEAGLSTVVGFQPPVPEKKAGGYPRNGEDAREILFDMSGRRVADRRLGPAFQPLVSLPEEHSLR